MVTRYLIKGIVKNISPLKIGSGEAEYTHSDILLDANDRPYIPATSFCGALKREIKKFIYELDGKQINLKDNIIYKF
ncbi:MAG TPA: RAMP superfamily CRISPR-associated protein [Ignavibacteriales bacterium]|nr:RAMP superfamily CRISPR-associated protein [Ignavibacteriales bacterium]HOL82267.1 RAMP superfamily CRISPR-associated protein [Ignavibacteriales bacterium]HPP34487.1 RAMP superfamily CRISPR-associated protein [Ignavibacteriales bacterium]HRR19635.1 RAMP superfamily CRISPR-associated protein [Ignavibacteriales bacterium]